MFLHVVQSVTIEVIQGSPQLTILKPCNFFLVVSKFKTYLEIVKLLSVISKFLCLVISRNNLFFC